MKNVRLTNLDGREFWLPQIGPYGAWGNLSWTTRWGSGACGMYEASWTMPLPFDFEHPALRRGTTVEIMDGSWRIGSSLILSEPARGDGLEDPWEFTATGLGREVEGDSSWYALDGSGSTTTVPTVAVGYAIQRGLPWAGYDSSVPGVAVGASSTSDGLNAIGSLLTASADPLAQRWGVWQDNLLRFAPDPTEPTYQVTPGVVSLGTADDDYATVVLGRYMNAATNTLDTVFAPTSPSAVEQRFGRRETEENLTTLGAISTATAQAYADGLLAKYKGRLQWTNGFTLTAQELLTVGGQPAVLSKVEAGEMVRLHGIYNDLLETNGQTWLDIIIGETKYVDGDPTIDISPLGLAARDLASVIEDITGIASDAA